MRRIFVLFALCGLGVGQATQDGKASGTAIPDQLSNHHVLLVPATAPGTGVAMWIAIGPNANLTILPVSQLTQKMNEGYRPFTFGELRENIAALVSANASLENEVKALRAAQPSIAPVEKTTAERDQEERAQAARIDAERQQQRKLEQARMLYNLMMMQAARPSYQLPMPAQPRPNVNCTSTTIGTTVYTDCH
jgi:regulator of replication initiation timing